MRTAARSQPTIDHLRTPNLGAAFSLVELLVVITIISILSAMLLSGISVVKNQASRNVCGENMRTIGAAIGAYQADNEGLYPRFAVGTQVQNWWNLGPGNRWQHFLEEYTETFNVFNCPTSRKYNDRFAVRDKADSLAARGYAPNGLVCLTAADTRVWIRYPKNPAGSPLDAWAASAPYGPMSDNTARIYLAKLSKTTAAYMAPNQPARIDKCPVISDGVWQNDGTNQSGNTWGAYFPHQKKGNFIFNDGHVESLAQSDFRTFTPIVQVNR